MIFLVDAGAWIEYFAGSKSGLILKRLLDNKNHKFIALECTLSELKCYCLRNNLDFNLMHTALKKNSILLPVLTSHWLEAAQIRHEIRKKIGDFGLIDSILIAKQSELKCQIVSGDRHFKGLTNTVYIGI